MVSLFACYKKGESTMKRLHIAVLIGGISFGMQLAAYKSPICATICKQVSCDNQTIIKQLDVIDGIYTITKPGAYALCDDLVAQIFIEADDVCLDLNDNTLTGPNDQYAISVSGQSVLPRKNIIIKNGTITSPQGNGLGIFMQFVNGFILDGLTFEKVSSAFLIFGSNDACLRDIDASENFVKNQPLMLISVGKRFDLSHIEASRCTIENASSNILLIVSSDNVSISQCRFNDNLCIDGSSQFIPLAIGNFNTVALNKCELNNNSVRVVSTTQEGIINGSFVSGTHLSISKSEFNNSVVESAAAAYGLQAINITDLTIDCCEANGTTINNAVASPSTSQGAIGISFIAIDGLHLTDSEANKSIHLLNTGTDAQNGPQGINFIAVTNSEVKNVCAVGSRVVAVEDATGKNPATGMRITFVEGDDTFCRDVNFSKCDCSHAFSAGNEAYGFFIEASNDLTFAECKGNGNEAQAFAVGFVIVANTNLAIKESCASNNKASALDGVGYGFALQSNNNVTITDSGAKNNSTAGIFEGDFPAVDVDTQAMSVAQGVVAPA